MPCFPYLRSVAGAASLIFGGTPKMNSKHLLLLLPKTNNIALPDFDHNRPGVRIYGIPKSKYN